eukprot:CAMPEP_0182416644 /NCGR_PEP_ID=MMETSP1167-20130531/1008_1 /TAXON_ID=2988 /ORGANISM="Mallomonas Sp, Strain CCMP3275" /LENGTH=164 /DNA_ID=CAMNT_0024589601 /DNA_START=14 /DNA_END=505 /DNA_ORIENTATION=-
MAAGLIGVVQFGSGFVAMSARKLFQSKAFLDQEKVKQLQEEHKKHFSEGIQKFGYPDMGNGRYSQLLPYQDWVNFNNAQRSHYNMIESSGPVLACLVTSGFMYPKVAAASGFTYAVGHILYSIGYITKGANGRIVGAVLSHSNSIFLFLLALYAGAVHVGCICD